MNEIEKNMKVSFLTAENMRSAQNFILLELTCGKQLGWSVGHHMYSMLAPLKLDRWHHTVYMRWSEHGLHSECATSVQRLRNKINATVL